MFQTTQSKISTARTHMLLDSPWFGALSTMLRLTESQCADMQTDGTQLAYNANVVDSLTQSQVTGLIAKCTLHCALRHPYRRGARDLKRWNEAASQAVYPMLQKANFELPKDAKINPAYADLSAEAIYALMDAQDDKPPTSAGAGSGQGDTEQSTPAGGFTDPQPIVDTDPTDADAPSQMSEVDWEVAAETAAMVARKRDRMNGGVDTALQASRGTKTDWHAHLRQFVVNCLPKDKSLSRPNRRFIADGLYIPGERKENMPPMVLAIDVSGSINRPLLDLFISDWTTLVKELRPEYVTVMYCNSSVVRVDTFAPDDEITINAPIGGGTAFQPVFDKVAELGDTPACLLYFTDLDGDQPKDPGYPVMWVTAESERRCGPFGDTIRISRY